MSDNRLLMVFDGQEIVIAVRHGVEWRSAVDDRNDIGDFLNKINSDSGFDAFIELQYEHDKEFCDPEVATEGVI
jgi:hypothetical protein